jgi:hypothetical protein
MIARPDGETKEPGPGSWAQVFLDEIGVKFEGEAIIKCEVVPACNAIIGAELDHRSRAELAKRDRREIAKAIAYLVLLGGSEEESHSRLAADLWIGAFALISILAHLDRHEAKKGGKPDGNSHR